MTTHTAHKPAVAATPARRNTALPQSLYGQVPTDAQVIDRLRKVQVDAADMERQILGLSANVYMLTGDPDGLGVKAAADSLQKATTRIAAAIATLKQEE